MLVATGVKVLIGTLFWEFQFQIVRAIFSALPSKTEKERAFKKVRALVHRELRARVLPDVGGLADRHAFRARGPRGAGVPVRQRADRPRLRVFRRAHHLVFFT